MEDKKNLLANTFTWLFAGLLVTFVVSYFTTIDNDTILSVYGAFNGYSYIVYIILELALAVALTAFIRKINANVAKILYLLYAALTGLTLSGIFILYTGESIAYTFLATSAVFGIFAVIGKTTNIDLSKLGIYLFVGLIAIIIAEIINVFVMSNTLNMLLIVLTIIVFCGYVAYDINRLLKSDFLSEDEDKKSIFYAFQLFLDFINLFIELLKLFGKSRD